MAKKKELFSPETKELLLSALNTFLAGFVMTVAGLIYVADLNTVLLSSAFWISVCLTGFRAGVKALTGYIISLK